ncbi:SCO1431 family membrane protein [Streptomyces sp. NPDC054863]
MTAASAVSAAFSARSRARTGGPGDDLDGPKLLEHVLGWALVVVVAVFVTGAGLM